MKNGVLFKILVPAFILLLWISCGSTNEKTPVQELPAQKPAKEKVIAEQSTLKCPQCGHEQTETLPTDYCLIQYTCKNCQQTFHPKDGDCCVFCSYGDHKCPSKQ